MLAAYPSLCLSVTYAKSDAARKVHLWQISEKDSGNQIWQAGSDGTIVLQSRPHLLLTMKLYNSSSASEQENGEDAKGLTLKDAEGFVSNVSADSRKVVGCEVYLRERYTGESKEVQVEGDRGSHEIHQIWQHRGIESN